MTTRSRARERGSENERQIAKLLNCKRTGYMRVPGTDAENDWLSVECKERAVLPVWIQKALVQAAKSAGLSQLPIAVLHQLGAPHGNDIVCMRLAAFRDWFGAQIGVECNAEES